MKKFLSILLALALMLGALAIPALADLASADIQLYPISYILNDYGDTEVSLKIYMRVINNSSHPLWIRIEDAQTDGTPLYAAGMSGIEAHFDTSNGTPDYILITPDDNKAAGSAALRKRGVVTMTVIAKDDLEYNELARETFEVDLSSLSEGLPDTSSSYNSTYPTDDYSYDYSSSSSNTTPAYTPASYDFQTLTKGSKGQAVKDLQQRLTDLGYLNDKVDGSFGLNTATAVMSFKYQHGMAINYDATPEMQQLLYSSSAQHYEEPWVPLIIGPEYKWYNPKDALKDVGTFYTHLVNRSHRDIRGYELYFYQTDIWGNKIYDDDGNWLHKWDFVHTIKSGYLEYSQAITIYPFAYTYSMWVGVHKIAFSDGEIREIDPDEIIYFECPVKK